MIRIPEVSVKRHVAFGYGSHVCIGQHLARMELTMALNTLLDRLPHLRLDESMPAPVIRGLTMRGADSVCVVFDKQIAERHSVADAARRGVEVTH